eukprot:353517-Chlamydomonas_euryale.AAC.15
MARGRDCSGHGGAHMPFEIERGNGGVHMPVGGGLEAMAPASRQFEPKGGDGAVSDTDWRPVDQLDRTA